MASGQSRRSFQDKGQMCAHGLATSHIWGVLWSDFRTSIGAEVVNSGRDVGEDPLDRLFAIDVDEQPALCVKGEERLCLCVEHFEPMHNDALAVVGAPFPVRGVWSRLRNSSWLTLRWTTAWSSIPSTCWATV